MIPLLLALLVFAVDPLGFEPAALKRAIFLTAGPLALLMLVPNGTLRRIATTALGAGLGALALVFAWSVVGTLTGGAPAWVGVKGLGVLLLLALFAVLARDDAATRPFRLGDCLLLLGVIAAIYAVAQRLGFDPIFDNPGMNAVAFFGNTNRAAEFLAPLVPLALAFRRTRQGAFKALATIALPLLIAATILTASRAGALAAGAGLLAFIVLAPDRSALRFEGVLIAIGLLLPIPIAGASGYAFKSVAESEASIVSPDYSPNRQRELLLEASLAMTKHAPIFGHGAGNFRFAFPKFREPEEARMRSLGGALSSAEDPHDEFLRLATEGGVPAALFFVVFLFAALLSVRSASLWPDGHPLRLAAPGYAAALLALLVLALFRSILDHAPVALMTAALGGSLLACRESGTKVGRSGPLFYVLPAWLLVIAFAGARSLSSEIAAGLAERSLPANKPLAALDLLSSARSFDGTNLAALQREAWLLEGLAHLDPKRVDEAVAARRRILALDPRHVTSRFRLAARAFERNEFAAALDNLRFGLRVLGEDGKDWEKNAVKRLLEQKEFLAAALFRRERVKSGKSTLGDIRAEADAAAKEKDPEHWMYAAELLGQFLELRPTDPDAAFDLAELHVRLGQQARADEYYQRSHLCRAAAALEHKDVATAKRSIASAQHYSTSYESLVLAALAAVLEKDTLPLEKLASEKHVDPPPKYFRAAIESLAVMPELAGPLKRLGLSGP